MSLLDDEYDIMDRADEVVLYTIKQPANVDIYNLKLHYINYVEAWYTVLLDIVMQYDKGEIKLINIGQVLRILHDNYWDVKDSGPVLVGFDVETKKRQIDDHISRTLSSRFAEYYRLTNFDTFISSLFNCYSLYQRDQHKRLVDTFKDDKLYNDYLDRIWRIIKHNDIKIKRTL
jgi:hypothetical protein